MSIRSCPFCGESNAIVCETYLSGDPGQVFAVSCRTRKCAGGIWALGFGNFKTPVAAIKAWNKRAPDSSQILLDAYAKECGIDNLSLSNLIDSFRSLKDELNNSSRKEWRDAMDQAVIRVEQMTNDNTWVKWADLRKMTIQEFVNILED